MTPEKWLIQPGQTRVIDLASVTDLKVGLVGGQVDIVGHDDTDVRIEIHSVSGKELRIEAADGKIEIDHPQLRWDNFLEVFRNFGAGGPKAQISVAVPHATALTLGVVSASALVAGLRADVRLNTVSGDLMVDGLDGDLSAHAVSGDVQARDVVGSLSANSVSGDVTVTGELAAVSVDTVSGATLIDAHGPVHRVSVNAVSGDVTLRLDEGYATNTVVRSVSGRVQIDGVTHSGKPGIGTTVSHTTGDTSGSFVDLRANSVSGAITVVRRTSAEA